MCFIKVEWKEMYGVDLADVKIGLLQREKQTELNS